MLIETKHTLCFGLLIQWKNLLALLANPSANIFVNLPLRSKGFMLVTLKLLRFFFVHSLYFSSSLQIFSSVLS